MVNFYGREQIFTSYDEVNSSNVTKVLDEVYTIHQKNEAQIKYLYEYYKGKQPVYLRTKEIRPEICNQIVENWANAIVSFKVGYLCGSPIQYVSGKSKKSLTKQIDVLNDVMDAHSKASVDKDLVEWQMICGTSYRSLFSDKDDVIDIQSLNPRNTFVIYSKDISQKPLAGVYIATKLERGKETTYLTVYTPTEIITVKAFKKVSAEKNPLGMIPIMEYPANSARLSVIEIVIDLLDAINDLDSNRLDGVEQFIQSLMVIYNADVGDETINTLKEKGLITLKSQTDAPADIKIISEQLDQNQTQTLKEDLIKRVREIVGLPSQGDGNSSDSSNNGAMLLKGGWENAETRARESEVMFKKSEIPFLKLLFLILSQKGIVNLEVSDVDIRFTRRNYENIQVKSQVLTTMLSSNKIHPRLAFEGCGMFIDPEEAYNMSVEYEEENKVENGRIEQPVVGNNEDDNAKDTNKTD
ncbi:MAG: phage portal protein [Methanobrevibacter sp.]|nr:phage portal protein [Methanobrevibacter sp.]